MSTKKPKYPTTAAGYFAYLMDYGGVCDIISPTMLRVKASSNGNDFLVDFYLDKPYNDKVENIRKAIMKGSYKIINVKMY